MNGTTLQPQELVPDVGARWMTVIFNNDYTPLEDVISQLMLVTHCNSEEAEIEAIEAHLLGKAPVFFGSEV